MMRTAVLMFSALALLGCTDAPTTPSRPDFELTDPSQRWDPSSVNSHVYGSFRIDLPGVATVITTGPANFPGHSPNGPGTCENGAWRNPQGRLLAGSMTKPHPHCISAPSAIEIVLEPISTCYAIVENTAHPSNTAPCNFFQGGQAEEGGGKLQFEMLGFSEAGDGVSLFGTSFIFSNGDTPRGSTSGFGAVSGYAIDASTISTTNRRVGTLTFDLAQFTSSGLDYIFFGSSNGCALDATISASCLNLVISADYAPLPAPNGMGTVQVVPGFLWISPASAPYNYMP